MKVATAGKVVGPLAIIGYILLVILGLLCVIGVCIPLTAFGIVGAGYALLYDGKTEQITYEENFDLKDTGYRILADSLEKCESEGKIAVEVTQDDVNNLLHYALEQVKNPITTKAYMVVNGETYHFYVDLNGYVIKSRAHITTSFREDKKTNSFVFKIKDISLGNINGFRGIGKKALDTFVKQETIDNFIASTGLSIKYDPDRLSLSYNKDDLLKDLTKMLGGDTGIYLTVFQSLLKQGLVELNFKSDKVIEGAVNLNKLRSNEYTTEDPGQITVNASDVRTKCHDNLLKLINNNILNPDDNNQLTTVFKYLFAGYKNSDDSTKALVDSLDLSCIADSIGDKTTYVGLNNPSENILNRMSENINVHGLVNGETHVCQLDENVISEYVRTLSVVGYTALVNLKTKDGLRVNFVTLDNFYCNIYRDMESHGEKTVDFIVRININGYPTSLAFSTMLPDEGIVNNSLTFTLRDMKYGEITDPDLIDTFFGIIAEALKGNDNSLTADKEHHSITFNFESIIKEAKKQVEDYVRMIPGKANWSGDEYFKGENVDLATIGDEPHDDGFLKITLKQPIAF